MTDSKPDDSETQLDGGKEEIKSNWPDLLPVIGESRGNIQCYENSYDRG